jgi:hypothetical protein
METSLSMAFLHINISLYAQAGCGCKGSGFLSSKPAKPAPMAGY